MTYSREILALNWVPSVLMKIYRIEKGFSIEDFFGNCDGIFSHLLKGLLKEVFIQNFILMFDLDIYLIH